MIELRRALMQTPAEIHLGHRQLIQIRGQRSQHGSILPASTDEPISDVALLAPQLSSCGSTRVLRPFAGVWRDNSTHWGYIESFCRGDWKDSEFRVFNSPVLYVLWTFDYGSIKSVGTMGRSSHRRRVI